METQGDQHFEADIRWTTHGVAHIAAAGWGGLGFGQGYACARDHGPTIADQIVKVRSERARFHGPGRHDANIASDFGYLALGVTERATELRAAQTPWLRELVSGYTAGYNLWVKEAGEAGSLPAWCAGSEWVRPIDELDFYAYLGDVALMGSGRNLASLIGRAEAPGPEGPAPAAPVEALGGAVNDIGASNGWALGGDVTASGHGIVMANPHFPWYGEACFWECHLTIPGELDVYGASLIGCPGVQIGFNAGVAWAHTFSNGHRFTLYREQLVPGSPTSYYYGTEERAMSSITYQVAVGGADGSVEKVQRELWRTHHGPMLNLPLLGWGMETAFSYRDANIENASVLKQFLGMCRATDMDSFQQVFAEVQGLPWVNTLAADQSGRAWYIDGSATPRISEAAQRRYTARAEADIVAALLLENRIALLEGNEPDDEWLDQPGAEVPPARSPGLVPFAEQPKLERRDWLVNANDSHWLPNATDQLVGFSPLNGFERRPRSLRTRQNLLTVQRLAASGGVTIESVLKAVLSNENLSAELLIGELLERAATSAKPIAGDSADELAAAVAVLDAWDRKSDLGSRGAALWREFMMSFPDKALREAGELFLEPFDPEHPLDTPSGLAEGDEVLESLVRAAQALKAAGVAADAPLGEIQWAARDDSRVPVHGGGEGEGLLNVLTPVGSLASQSLAPTPPLAASIAGRTERTGLRKGGYQVSYGTSFLMAVELTDDGPNAIGLLAYGQSSDPASVHHRDGTEAYASKAPRRLLFRNDEIEVATLERRSLNSRTT